MNRPQDLLARVSSFGFVEDLFDRIPDVVFFVKDERARYTMVNRTLVERCGRRSKAELLGRTAAEVFPAELGKRFVDQDRKVLAGEAAITGALELHLYPGGLEGWCLTEKLALCDGNGTIIGLAGVSRDLGLPRAEEPAFRDLAESVAYLQTRYGEPLRVSDLAVMAGMSEYRFNRRIRSIFQITAGQLIAKTRIDAATHLLRETRVAIADIAHACGYSDQSAFSRQFKISVGITPSQYRKRHA